MFIIIKYILSWNQRDDKCSNSIILNNQIKRDIVYLVLVFFVIIKLSNFYKFNLK